MVEVDSRSSKHYASMEKIVPHVVRREHIDDEHTSSARVPQWIVRIRWPPLSALEQPFCVRRLGDKAYATLAIKNL